MDESQRSVVHHFSQFNTKTSKLKLQDHRRTRLLMKTQTFRNTAAATNVMFPSFSISSIFSARICSCELIMTLKLLIATARANHRSARNISKRNRHNMDSTQKKGGDSSDNYNISQPKTSEHVSNEPVSEKIQSESEGQDVTAVSTVSEVTPVINTECTEESQIPCSTDNEESLAEISEDPFESSKSEALEAEKESRLADGNVLGKESPETCYNQSTSEEIKVQPNDCNTTTCNEETVSKTEKHEEMATISQKQTRPRENRDQCCQTNCLSDKASNNEVKILKEKLAISKKDTDTMQKLLEDVRKDYEELQKSFEKRESDVKNKPLAEELMKENDETKKEKAEVKRGKTSKRGNKVSASDEKSESRSSEKKKADVTQASLTTSEDIYVGEVACPCFVQSIRKIVTDVREDFKDTISVFKQSSAEHCASIGKELTKLKDEYMCALEKKDSEISVFQEVIKSLQSRIVDAEREAVAFRAVISCSLEEKQKLYDDIRGLKDELLRTRQENETSQAELQKIKHGLKRYCTAEEYEELQRSNFKFRAGDCSVNVDGGQASEIDDNVSQLKNKVAKFYPVLKNAKKEMAKLKEEKQDVENRLQEKISEGEELENYLNKQLSEALIEVRRNERALNELKEELVALKVENAKLNANIDGLEEEKENMLKKYGQELEAVKNKLKKNNESLQFHKVKSEQLQEENDALNDSYLGLKNYLEEEKAKMLVGMTESGEYLSDDEDSMGPLLKVRTA